MMRQLFLVFIVFLFFSCGRTTFNIELSEIDKFHYKPELETYKMFIHIKGKVKCPCSLTLTMNKEKSNSTFDFEGTVDDFESSDWYSDEMGFLLDKPECAGENTWVEIAFYK